MHFLDPPDIKVISLMFQLTSYSSLRACEFNISLPLRKETVKTLHTQLISTSFPSSEIKTGPLDMTETYENHQKLEIREIVLKFELGL